MELYEITDKNNSIPVTSSNIIWGCMDKFKLSIYKTIGSIQGGKFCARHEQKLFVFFDLEFSKHQL